MSIGKTRNYVTWALTLLLALAFLAAGYAKVSANPDMVEAFTRFGLPDWFRVTIGALEILGAIALVIPALTGMASFGLSLLMLGALGCHLLHDPLTLAIPTTLVFAALTWIWLTRKSVVPVFLHRHLIG